MKKSMLVGLMLLITSTLFAQTTISEKNIVGKWMLHSVEQIGMFRYETQGQKVVFDTAFSNKLQGTETTPEKLSANIRDGLAALDAFGFEFFADGTSKLIKSVDDIEPGTYVVDATKSTITSTGNVSGVTEVMDAHIVDGLLVVKLLESETAENMIMRFSKK